MDIAPLTHDVCSGFQVSKSNFGTLPQGNSKARVERNGVPHDLRLLLGQSMLEDERACAVRPVHFETLPAT